MKRKRIEERKLTKITFYKYHTLYMCFCDVNFDNWKRERERKEI